MARASVSGGLRALRSNKVILVTVCRQASEIQFSTALVGYAASRDLPEALR